MDLKTLFLIKPVVYFLVLLIAARGFRALGHPGRGTWVLALLALGRAMLGLALGLGLMALVDQSSLDVHQLVYPVSIGVVGLGLWLSAGKVAFRTARLVHLVAFSAAAEVVSLGMDYVMLGEASKVIH